MRAGTKNKVEFRYRVHLALSRTQPTVVVSHADSTMVFTTTVEPKKEEEKKEEEKKDEEKKEETAEAGKKEEAKKEEPKKEEPKKEEPKKAEEKKEEPKAAAPPAEANESVKINLTESKRLGYHYFFNWSENVGVYYLASGFSAIQPQMLIKTAHEWNAGEVQFLLEQFAGIHTAKDFEDTLISNGYSLRSRVYYSNPAAIVCEAVHSKKQEGEPEEEYEKRVVKRTENFLIPTKVEKGKQKRSGPEEGVSFLRVGKFFTFRGKLVKEERISYGCTDLPCDHSENISVFWNPKVEPAVESA